LWKKKALIHKRIALINLSRSVTKGMEDRDSEVERSLNQPI